MLYDIWPRPSAEAWTYILGFGLLQALLQLFVPGPEFQGPITPKGNVPKYKVTMGVDPSSIPFVYNFCKLFSRCKVQKTAYSQRILVHLSGIEIRLKESARPTHCGLSGF